MVFQTYTPRTLLKNNGEQGKPVYLAVKGKVYDVSPGRNFYGPGGPYENFAGRDATRGLACQSFDEDMLTKDLDGPLDDCKDLDKDQLENLHGWVERFDEKVRTRMSSLRHNIDMNLPVPRRWQAGSLRQAQNRDWRTLSLKHSDISKRQINEKISYQKDVSRK